MYDKAVKFQSLFAITVVSLLLISGCAINKDDSSALTSSSLPEIVAGVPIQLSGSLFSGFEAFYFTPAGSEQKWWISSDSHKAKGWSIITSGLGAIKCDENLTFEGRKIPCGFQSKSLNLSVTAVLTAKGHYGHLGQYDREIKFIEIRE